MPGTRFAAGSFALQLDKTMCGFLKSVEGGAIAAEVIVERDAVVKKHIGRPRYEEFVLGLDFSHDKSVYQWLADTIAGKLSRRDGSVVTVSSQQKAVAARQFLRAFVSEITVPAA